ncbi:uncharacterized protein LOC135255251 isoform X1 [Anguilla rostrata]|uniref:uncharacterized protein LOC118226972 isoform X1 n=1 Tax=Anguilla anguilla TaxID=7936 RepID=UPI0015A8F85B|nr:uncharacterized protein LOC118226972 isoform X1 [Anguilla anguilla]
MNKKKRGPNWTAEEKSILLKEYSKRRAILESRVNSDLSKLGKLKHWEEIVARINAVNPLARRSIYDIKKKLLNIAYTARNNPRLRHTLRKRASAPPTLPAPTQFSEVPFLSSPTACPQETASTPASVEVSDSEQEPVDRLTQAPQPPVSPIPESSRTHDEPQELDGQGRDFQRLHAAITDCGDRIVAALEPIADSFQQLTHQVGVLVEVLAKQAQVRPPCRHACPTCKCPQEQANSQEAVHHLKSEVEQFSWET